MLQIDSDDIKRPMADLENHGEELDQLVEHIAALDEVTTKLDHDLNRAQQWNCTESILSILRRQATSVREQRDTEAQELRDGRQTVKEKIKTMKDIVKARNFTIDQTHLAMASADRLARLHLPAALALKALRKSIKRDRRPRFWNSNASSIAATRLTEFHRLATHLSQTLRDSTDFDRLEAQFRDLICLVLKKREDQVDFENLSHVSDWVSNSFQLFFHEAEDFAYTSEHVCLLIQICVTRLDKGSGVSSNTTHASNMVHTDQVLKLRAGMTIILCFDATPPKSAFHISLPVHPVDHFINLRPPLALVLDLVSLHRPSSYLIPPASLREDE